MSNGSLAADQPVVRLCHIIQVKGFDGYGFNLHAEKGKPGQYIGKVDEKSPAEAAGLKEGDRIIEVNGVNIGNETHKQVVQKIKAVPNETKLLVVDREADAYFKENNITIKGSLPNVVYIKTPVPDVGQNGVNGEKADKDYEETQSQKSDHSTTSADQVLGTHRSGATTPSTESKDSVSYSPEPQLDSADEGFSSLNKSSGNGTTLERTNHNSSLNLNMTAKELRAQLASRKKYDPKKDSMDFKQKFEIVQKL